MVNISSKPLLVLYILIMIAIFLILIVIAGCELEEEKQLRNEIATIGYQDGLTRGILLMHEIRDFQKVSKLIPAIAENYNKYLNQGTTHYYSKDWKAFLDSITYANKKEPFTVSVQPQVTIVYKDSIGIYRVVK